MTSFHLDPKDTNRKYEFTGDELARLLSGIIESFIEYKEEDLETNDTAKLFAMNEVFASLDKRVTYDS